ncbi:GDSL-type esterase/lipase family protein [Burkholderia ambifaria]|nr:GDSL-type esterase/lipase family protein [Burkholderia ambifaria]
MVRKLVASAVGYTPAGASNAVRTVQDELRSRAIPQDKGAKGDGVTNDTAAFTAFEAENVGRVVDLAGLTYVVNAVPTKNAYQNGVFMVSGARQQAAGFRNFATTKTKYHAFGGQLRLLHEALLNPLEQQTTIAFFGDSITWGAGLTENAVQTPGNGTMADPRDNYASPSFVNEFKRYVGERYFDNVAPVLSNCSYSTAGQSTATFTRTETLYTNLPPFSAPTLVGSANSTDSADSGTLLGERHNLAVADSSSTAAFTFPFTGSGFTLVYNSVPGQSADYELFVNGVSQGVFHTDTGSLQANVTRAHTFTYARNATIMIKAEYPSGGSGVCTLRLSALQVQKSCTIVNQGIIGLDTYNFKNYNFGAFGPSCITPDLNYVFMQLGTNDRIATTGRNQPQCANNFKRNLVALLGLITPSASVILMNANPAALESPPTYAFDTQAVRNVVHLVGVDLSMDVIDNHTIFRNMDTTAFTADGLHPNLLGHAMIAANIINAFEAS